MQLPDQQKTARQAVDTICTGSGPYVQLDTLTMSCPCPLNRLLMCRMGLVQMAAVQAQKTAEAILNKWTHFRPLFWQEPFTHMALLRPDTAC